MKVNLGIVQCLPITTLTLKWQLPPNNLFPNQFNDVHHRGYKSKLEGKLVTCGIEEEKSLKNLNSFP